MVDHTGVSYAPYRVSEFAKIAGMTEVAIYQGIKDGTIPSLRVGRRLFVPRERGLRWLRGEE
ncbi:helix-turn-helix domain-containing protein [Arthrobacter sp. Y-9]|uniref:helix-turn-helix domain-containing protein n=1 Tax=Arthrobacter sp. Y-9 TaxID=3039385 RepID=UPI00241EAD65|nr:helix-turn-helix domain-containing protein [Arthrobacter sp. Y-9]WFR84650.1 helix-turn-helix domain-containing protein [Arthrobacter sp. Y-9]